ncbi:hypothetical protein GON03_09680 [Nocardioides sp. MAH-18]|uniref:DUF3352 domain-containing protein n=1 Tax=Nocardioides agri TaxID=2682843 RepID=A0A6L6XRN3_9ACTN|nr:MULTISPECIES: hypothetical protein [unclassified Nocardioides]MBA2954594.1 hypothetical protein [Nocardioides sp. CGMCC 1.13656]MVQ49452.1 hypothetical protein [Nocardioides sp. MAH-18]
MRRGLVAATAAVGVLALAGACLVGVRWWQSRDRTTFAEATSYAPADAARLTWTDWAAVRDAVGTDDLDTLLDDAFERDLSSGSALVQSAPVLERAFGFSPASIAWELLSQSSDGAVVIVRLGGGSDLDGVADHLADAGFTEPEEDDGVWQGGPDLLAGIGSDLTPELGYVALVPDHDLVLTSDQPDYLQQVVDDLGDDSLPAPMRDVVAASGSPQSAVVYDGDYTCSELAMSHADAEEQATAERLISEAGGVDPLTAYAMSVQPDREVRVAMAFSSAEQARANADSRAVLAAGPAPGQGGDFSDRFTVESATAEGDVATLDLAPAEGAYVLSDLSSGPVLFATC